MAFGYNKEDIEEIVFEKQKKLFAHELQDLKNKLESSYRIQEDIIKTKTEFETKLDVNIKQFHKNIEDANKFKDLLLEITRENKEVLKEFKEWQKNTKQIKLIWDLYEKNKLIEKGLTGKEKTLWLVYEQMPVPKLEKQYLMQTNLNINTYKAYKQRLKKKGYELLFSK